MVCVHLCRWDVLTGNLELVEEIDGHTDIVYGSFDPKYFRRWEILLVCLLAPSPSYHQVSFCLQVTSSDYIIPSTFILASELGLLSILSIPRGVYLALHQ
jgi:hypothetical protein